MTTRVTIDVVSDVICPWCFLGKRRLDKAIAMVPEATVIIRWHPFFLDPTVPAEGMDRQSYLLNKFGPERVKTMHDPLIAAGKDDDVPYKLDRITRTPNTLNAHRVIRWAAAEGKQQQMVEALFMAYWSEGRDIGNTAILASVAKTCGMKESRVARDLATDKDKLDIFTEVRQAQSMGVQGVPTFIFGQKRGVSGAQSAEFLASGIRQAATG